MRNVHEEAEEGNARLNTLQPALFLPKAQPSLFQYCCLFTVGEKLGLVGLAKVSVFCYHKPNLDSYHLCIHPPA